MQIAPAVPTRQPVAAATPSNGSSHAGSGTQFSALLGGALSGSSRPPGAGGRAKPRGATDQGLLSGTLGMPGAIALPLMPIAMHVAAGTVAAEARGGGSPGALALSLMDALLNTLRQETPGRQPSSAAAPAGAPDAPAEARPSAVLGGGPRAATPPAATSVQPNLIAGAPLPAGVAARPADRVGGGVLTVRPPNDGGEVGAGSMLGVVAAVQDAGQSAKPLGAGPSRPSPANSAAPSYGHQPVQALPVLVAPPVASSTAHYGAAEGTGDYSKIATAVEAPAATDAAAGAAASAVETLDGLAGALALTVRSGRTEATLTLHPAHLGEVRVEIAPGTDGVRIRIATQSDAASALLRAHLPELQAGLERRQVTVSELHVLPNPPSLSHVAAAFDAPPRQRGTWDREGARDRKDTMPAEDGDSLDE